MSFIHFGDSLVTIPFTTRLENCEQRGVSLLTGQTSLEFSLTSTDGSDALRPKRVSISLATLSTAYMSLRLASNLRSKTVSSRPKRCKTSSRPTSVSFGSSSMPLVCSSLRYLPSTPSSSREQHIPSESYPLIFPLLIVPPGSFAPSVATITFNPFLMFGAPQTMWRTPYFGPQLTVVK